MRWIYSYQLVLFDFDGVLVNTEELHYRAYQHMCKERGFPLQWEWKTYLNAAMFEATGLRDAIYAAFPALYGQEPNWDILYKEKKAAYTSLLQKGSVQLMPGVEQLLLSLQEAGIKRCVVTHSSFEQMNMIRNQLPLLKTIPHWITREDYSQAKPHPECYQKAISLYGSLEDRIIGFEDSPRGLRALLGSTAQGVLVNPHFQPKEIAPLVAKPFAHFSSFVELCALHSSQL